MIAIIHQKFNVIRDSRVRIHLTRNPDMVRYIKEEKVCNDTEEKWTRKESTRQHVQGFERSRNTHVPKIGFRHGQYAYTKVGAALSRSWMNLV